MAINLKEEKGITIVDVRNDINNETVNEFKEVLQNIADNAQDRVIIDFSEVNYLCSSGLAIIGNTLKKLLNQNGSLKIVHVQRRIFRLFSMTKLADHLEFFESIEEAIKSFPPDK